jgi:hypothetical protein
MTKRMPPVPPAGRSPKGPGDQTVPLTNKDAGSGGGGVPGNLKEQDRQGNIAQNTTHQGYQQDR